MTNNGSSKSISVRIDGISKRFTHRVKGEVYAARDVSLDIAPGEFLTLLGPSGCGKTTTLRMIAGFEHPDEGTIAFDGQDVTNLAANARGIGFVFQNYALFPHLTVFENVAYGLRVRELASDEIVRAVTEVLALVGLAGYEPQFPAQLSGGEQQRVALARAIVIRPRVLLFDEPLSNLDAKLRVQMRGEIRALQRRLAITTIYVTHDQEEAMAVSDRIAVMERGTIVQQGSAADLYHRPASLFVAQFIGRANLIPGRVETALPGPAVITALGERFAARELPEGSTHGDRVQLLVRPEAIALTDDDVRAGLLPATIIARTFLGEKIEYLVQCNGETLLAVQPGIQGDDRFTEGMKIGIRFLDRAMTVLREEVPSQGREAQSP